MLGLNLPDGAPIPAELMAQVTGNAELQQHIEQLRAQLASLPATENESAAANIWVGAAQTISHC